LGNDEVGSACSIITDKRDNRGFRLGDLKEGRAFGRTCRRWEDNEERILKKYNVRE
jgi:hypothetical protein